jgi:hypothetical protein
VTTIHLDPIDFTPKVADDLEQSGLIIRLAPRRHELPAGPGETLWEPIYDSSEALGPHRLITVSVNKTTLDEFGSHADNEEFLLIGDDSMKPLYLVVALHGTRELDERIARRALTPEDFICLRLRYNDPEVSFFTMLADVPHGEAAGRGQGRPATFYVTEPRDLDTEITQFGDYVLIIRGQ